MAQATKGTPVKSMPPGSQVRAAHPESLTVGSHGILRLMNRPAQWVITITLLISWSFAGVILFDFVSEDQIARIQDFGNDPMLAVNKALEGIEHRMNLMNDMFNNAQAWFPTMTTTFEDAKKTDTEDDTPQVLRRKGEFLPPMEKVAEILGKKQDPFYTAYIAARSSETEGVTEETKENGAEDTTDELEEIMEITKDIDSSEDDEVDSGATAEETILGPLGETDITEKGSSTLHEAIEDQEAELKHFGETIIKIEEGVEKFELVSEVEVSDMSESVAGELFEYISDSSELPSDEKAIEELDVHEDMEDVTETVKGISDAAEETFTTETFEDIPEFQEDESTFVTKDNDETSSIKQEKPTESSDLTHEETTEKDDVDNDASKCTGATEITETLPGEDKEPDTVKDVTNLSEEQQEEEIDTITETAGIEGEATRSDDHDEMEGDLEVEDMEKKLVLVSGSESFTVNLENATSNDEVQIEAVQNLLRTNDSEVYFADEEEVLEEVKEAKEKKAREEIYKIIQEMREEKNEREEEEIVLQQINKTVETVRKQEMDKKEAKISRKEKKDAVKVQEPAEAVSLKEPASKRKEAELLKEKLKPALEKKEVEIKKPKPAFVKKEADLIKEETKPTLTKKEAEVKVKVEPALEKKEAEEEKEKVKPDLAKKVDAMKKKVRRAPVMKGAEVIKKKDKQAPEKKWAEVIKEKDKPAPEKKVAEVIKEKDKPAPERRYFFYDQVAEVIKEKVKPAPKKKGAEVIKEKDKSAPEKKVAEVIKEKDKPAPEKKVAEVIKEKVKPAPEKKVAEVIKEKDKPASEKKVAEVIKEKVKPTPETKVAEVIKEKVKPTPEKKVAEVIKEKVKPAPEKKVAEVIKEKVKPAPEKIVAEILKEAVGSAPMQKVIQVEAEKVVLAAPAKKEITKEKPRAPPKKEAVQEKAEAHAPTEVALRLLEPESSQVCLEDAGLIGLDLELLNSINQKLSLLDLLRKDIGEMKSDLESTQNQITLLRMDNRTVTELKPTAVKTKTAASREKARVARKDKVAPKVKVTSEPKEKEIIPKKAVEEKEPLKKEPNQVSEEVVDQTEKKVTVEQVKEEPEVPKDIPVVEEEDVPYFQCFFVDEDDTQYPFFPFSPPVW
ncbi:hypothetical protein DNTS_003609 [Danionella cerebrum]|uniref:Uncharacterized protein n=1 Tax=Danionella cerebrum TaxID=2873325 RepID=A0A553QHD3_9TELE|nr:hypothetical protein DNTS_003609 [Danionella translucida]